MMKYIIILSIIYTNVVITYLKGAQPCDETAHGSWSWWGSAGFVLQEPSLQTTGTKSIRQSMKTRGITGITGTKRSASLLRKLTWGLQRGHSRLPQRP